MQAMAAERQAKIDQERRKRDLEKRIKVLMERMESAGDSVDDEVEVLFVTRQSLLPACMRIGTRQSTLLLYDLDCSPPGIGFAECLATILLPVVS